MLAEVAVTEGLTEPTCQPMLQLAAGLGPMRAVFCAGHWLVALLSPLPLVWLLVWSPLMGLLILWQFFVVLSIHVC